MAKYVEYHLIQSFAPSNLNRDDTGAPKDAMFGGYRRARISSQCLKRAIRLYMKQHCLVDPQFMAVRTRKLVRQLVEQFSDVDAGEVERRVIAALNILGLDVTGEGDTEYLLFLGAEEVRKLKEAIGSHWKRLGEIADAQEAEQTQAQDQGNKKPTGKKSTGGKVEDLRQALTNLLDGGKAVDIALFGRMLADRPELSREAACQVAHAISVHRVEREFDYYTAVDDLSREGESGAGMIGETEFNAATYYRYAVIDWETLVENLQGDRELAAKAIGGFTEAIVRAIPTGKQNSFAAHNLPGFVGVALRSCPVNLANAFEAPVWPRADKSISRLAVEALAREENRMRAAYGFDGHIWAYMDLTEGWKAANEPGDAQDRLEGLVSWLQERLGA